MQDVQKSGDKQKQRLVETMTYLFCFFIRHFVFRAPDAVHDTSQDSMFMQRQTGTGIFACNGFDVYSDHEIDIDGYKPLGYEKKPLKSVSHFLKPFLKMLFKTVRSTVFFVK